MLISDSHEFIFLRMRKVASTSMKAILLPMCVPKPQGRLRHILSRAKLGWDYHNHVFRAHDDIRAIKKRMPAEKFNRYFKFAFVRNPWDRLVSEYEFLLERPAHGRHARVKKLDSFKEFIEMQIPRKDAYQINMLCDRKGKMIMDFVGRLENLQNDWQVVCERIDIPFTALPRRNATEHKHFQDYYDHQSRQLVARHWAREIDMFGYTFD